jgi:type I restriction enzyme R subunit
VSHRAKLASQPFNTGETPWKCDNFAFLTEHHRLLVAYGAMAELYVFTDPDAALVKLRKFAELLAELVAVRSGVALPIDANFFQILDRLRELPAVNRRILDLFHQLRKAGNEAAHARGDTSSEARYHLRNAHTLGVWFCRTFGQDPNFTPPTFDPPSNCQPTHQVDRLHELEQELEEQRCEHQRLEEALRRRESQLTDLQDKQGRMEQERKQLMVERDELQQRLSDDKTQLQDENKRAIEDEFKAKSKQLEDYDGRFR